MLFLGWWGLYGALFSIAMWILVFIKKGSMTLGAAIAFPLVFGAIPAFFTWLFCKFLLGM